MKYFIVNRSTLPVVRIVLIPHMKIFLGVSRQNSFICGSKDQNVNYDVACFFGSFTQSQKYVFRPENNSIRIR